MIKQPHYDEIEKQVKMLSDNASFLCRRYFSVANGVSDDDATITHCFYSDIILRGK